MFLTGVVVLIEKKIPNKEQINKYLVVSNLENIV